MAHPGTSCPKKMKTAAKLPFSHRKHYCMDHVWGVGFFGTFHSEKMASRTSKPHVSYRHQKTVKCLWAAWFFFNTCGGVPLNTKMAHPGTSIPKKWGVAPQNHLFQLGRNKRLSTFMGGLIFRSCCHIVQKHAKTIKSHFWILLGDCRGVPREH